jgi:hypothetical protein
MSNVNSGPVATAASESWANLDQALRIGLRGLPGNTTLAKLLAKEREVRNVVSLPALNVTQILTWAASYYERTACWPTANSGTVPDAPGETWRAIDGALRKGARTLPGGSSLAHLLKESQGNGCADGILTKGG